MSFKHLTDEERAALITRVRAGLTQSGVTLEQNDWLDRLILKVARRAPRHARELEIRKVFEESGDEPPEWSERDESWFSEVCPATVEEMRGILERAEFQEISQVLMRRDEKAFQAIVDRLNDQLKIKGMLYNRGADPEDEYPKVITKIWEAMAKWDGRDFTAYIARTIKNYCIDRIKARKKEMPELPETVADGRPAAQTRERAETRDTLDHVLAAVHRLEDDGSVGPLDGALFQLILKGRSVVQMVEDLASGPVIPALEAAHKALCSKKKLLSGDALALNYLIDGLDSSEVAILTGLSEGALNQAAAALQGISSDSENLELTRSLCRSGLTLTELGRASQLTANAVNLRVNRMRLKIWIALCDAAYESLSKRRRSPDKLALAIVQYRCQSQGNPPCHMYKGRGCKAEAPISMIIERSGLSVSESDVLERMDELRDEVLDEVGRQLPDYNACLYERKLEKE